MLLNRKKYRFVHSLIDRWLSDGIITPESASRLKDSVQVSRFDWKRLATYSFWIAGISFAISVSAFLLDEFILELIRKIFSIPDFAKSALLMVLSAGLYCFGFIRKRKNPDRLLSSEFLLFIGAICTGIAILLFGKAVGSESSHFSLLILPAGIIYMGIGALFPSAPMWILGILTMGTWFGTETGYVSGWGAYFLGMSYPLRFVPFGLFLVALSYVLNRGADAVAGNTDTRDGPSLFLCFVVDTLHLRKLQRSRLR
ncbi:MAG: DUF2157 domain-containing protein [Spirochaetota bacterium]